MDMDKDLFGFCQVLGFAPKRTWMTAYGKWMFHNIYDNKRMPIRAVANADHRYFVRTQRSRRL